MSPDSNDSAADTPAVPDGYPALLAEIKERIRTAQVRAALAVNRELVLLYWQIGRDILLRQQAEGWGTKVIDRLAADLRPPSPASAGSPPATSSTCARSPRRGPTTKVCNKLLHEFRGAQRPPSRQADHPGDPRVVRPRHHPARVESRRPRTSDRDAAARAAGQGDHQLRPDARKDPYNFDFLTLGDDARERELEAGLLAHVRQFLLELGGFALLGSQYPLTVGEKDYYLDLLFYHVKLRCYVVIDLKMGEFEPEFAGKMNFYLAAVDDLLRHPDDDPSVGLILCKTRDRVTVEYALRNTATPIGVAAYELTQTLPAPLAAALPTVAQIESELAG